MRNATRTILTGVSSIVLILAFQGSPAFGQLGGYGAMAGGSSPSMGGVSSGVAPFAGRFGASMSSGSAGSAVSFRPRASAPMSGTRTSFTIGPMGGAIGQGSARRPFVLPDLGTSRVGMRRPMPASPGMGVMPPNFGYPFRQPPSLLTPSSSSSGMSM